MKNFSKMLWGIVLIVIGIAIALNALNIANINFFFKGWWTLFIIIPCLIGLFDRETEGKTGNLIRYSNWSCIASCNTWNNRHGYDSENDSSNYICGSRTFYDI